MEAFASSLGFLCLAAQHGLLLGMQSLQALHLSCCLAPLHGAITVYKPCLQGLSTIHVYKPCLYAMAASHIPKQSHQVRAC